MKDLEKKLQASLIPNKLQAEVLAYVKTLEDDLAQLRLNIAGALEILQL